MLTIFIFVDGVKNIIVGNYLRKISPKASKFLPSIFYSDCVSGSEILHGDCLYIWTVVCENQSRKLCQSKHSDYIQ